MWGERVVAFIVPDDPRAPPDLEELRDWVAVRLERYNAPKVIVILPNSTDGASIIPGRPRS